MDPSRSSTRPAVANQRPQACVHSLRMPDDRITQRLSEILQKTPRLPHDAAIVFRISAETTGDRPNVRPTKMGLCKSQRRQLLIRRSFRPSSVGNASARREPRSPDMVIGGSLALPVACAPIACVENRTKQVGLAFAKSSSRISVPVDANPWIQAIQLRCG